MSYAFVVCTTSPVPDRVRAEALPGIRFVTLPSLEPDAVRRELATIRPDGYLVDHPELGPYVDGPLVDAAPGLRIVTYTGQSPDPAFYADNLDLEALQTRGILATTTPDTGHHPVAETAIALLLQFDIDIAGADAARKAGRAYPTPMRRTGLSGRTLGVVGMGVIGRRVAEIAACLGMHVVYFSRTRRAVDATFVDLPDLFGAADHVTLHLPLGAKGLVDGEVLSHAHGIGLIDTTSITDLVEPSALLRALDDGRVRRFALEGRLSEPYDSRLRTRSDVVLLPPYATHDTARSELAGWRNYLRTLSALIAGDEVPFRIGVAQS